MSGSYVPLLIFFSISAVNALGMLVASQMLNPHRPTPVKAMPYESGMIPFGDTRTRISVVLAGGLGYEWMKGGLEWD